MLYVTRELHRASFYYCITDNYDNYDHCNLDTLKGIEALNVMKKGDC